MNSFLIHHENTPLLESFKSSIKFDISNDIDEYISTTILSQIHTKNPDIIFIKDTLSSNYLELYGLILAYHIRFEERFKFLPIVILSDLDGFTLNRFEPMARILFTKNIFLEANSKKTLEKYSQKNIEPLTTEEYQTHFLNLIEVAPPENSSNHSIANAWAIDRWALFLKVESDAIVKNRDKISSMLYYKYLVAKNPIDASKPLGYKRPKLGGKIFYIDDEWSKGWSDIFEKYFPPTVTFKTLEEDFKTLNHFSLQPKIKSVLLKFTPDVVILDLRLIENDHKREEITSFTGIKIRDIIKEINPAIQVIMFTATSKSRILEELYQHNILGYIKKEDPQERNIKTKESFAKLAELVDKGLEKKWLKENRLDPCDTSKQ